MDQQNGWNSFPWIDERQLEEIFRHVVPTVNEVIKRHVSKGREIWEKTPPQDKARTIRGVFIGTLDSACASYDNLVLNSAQGSSYLEFPGGEILIIRKTTNPLLPPEESKTFREARLTRNYLASRGEWPPTENELSQLPLLPLEEMEVKSNSKKPLEYLEPYSLVYQCEGDKLSAVHIQHIDWVNDYVIDHVTLDLTKSAEIYSDEEHQQMPPRPSFTISERVDEEGGSA